MPADNISRVLSNGMDIFSFTLKFTIKLRNSVDMINRKNKIHIESIRSIKFGK